MCVCKREGGVRREVKAHRREREETDRESG